MSTKERKERERLARKQAILDAAREVFFEKGFQATTMDQIAEAAELSKGSLYIHFPTKEELYVSILIEGIEMLNGHFRTAIRGVEGWEAQLRKICDAYYHFYREHKNYFKILFLLQHGEISSKVSESLYGSCLDMGLVCLATLSKALENGMAMGEIRRQNAMELAIILWGALNGVILLHEGVENKDLIPFPLDKMIQTGFTLIIEGLRKR
ncbi:MAG: TetR/AcrR family transcriptional regulator [Deltaproteobacteria bacterium]|nr:TetR/AcrR family transcriptional regulator [Deltaproteobacteria bacterium]